jgi:hypothetical protein
MGLMDEAAAEAADATSTAQQIDRACLAGITRIDVAHRGDEMNGIRIHLGEPGRGPLVILCHDFLESRYSSRRHQLRALLIRPPILDWTRAWTFVSPYEGAADHAIGTAQSCPDNDSLFGTEGVGDTSKVQVPEGTPDRGDMLLGPEERALNRTMMVRCSRAFSERLVLDL